MRCQVLNRKGRKCNREATKTLKFFGDTGTFSKTTWVRVYVCDEHHEELKESKEVRT